MLSSNTYLNKRSNLYKNKCTLAFEKIFIISENIVKVLNYKIVFLPYILVLNGSYVLRYLLLFFSTGGFLRLEGPVFMRRPGSLLKSPSVDSESSDPSQHHQGNKLFALHGTERRQLMAARYR